MAWPILSAVSEPALWWWGGAVLVLLFIARLIQTWFRFKAITGKARGASRPEKTFWSTEQTGLSTWTTPFAQYLMPRVLKNQPFPITNEQMLETLLTYRFPFTPLNMDPAFPQAVKDTLGAFPPILIQALYTRQVPIELDVVCEIPAMMDPEAPKLMLSRYFLMDNQLFPIEKNPVYPYSLQSILLHELGHFLDWQLTPEPESLSGTEIFRQAFHEDVAHIPASLIQSFDTCTNWREQYGGFLRLPKEKRYQTELSMFIHQEEEVFGDAVVYLMTGHSREMVETHFPRTLAAVEQLLREAFESVSHIAHEAPAS